jgi:hypothetical protein
MCLSLGATPITIDAQRRRGGPTATDLHEAAEATKRHSERLAQSNSSYWDKADFGRPSSQSFRFGFSRPFISLLNDAAVQLLPLRKQANFAASVGSTFFEDRNLELRALAGSRRVGPDRLRRGVIIHNALPITAADYQAVFGETITVAARHQMASAARAERRIEADRRALRSLAGFKTVIRANRDQVHLILAHNEGGAARTPDGKWVDLRELAKECGRLSALCVIVSCRSANYLKGRALGIGHDIGIEDAVRIAGRVAAIIAAAPIADASGDPPRLLDAPALAERVNALLYRSTITAYAVIPVRRSSAVLAFLVIACRPDKDEESACSIDPV